MSMNDLCCGGSRSRVGCEYHDPALQPKPPAPIVLALEPGAMPGCIIDPCGALRVGGLPFFANYCVKFDERMFDLNIQIESPSQAEPYLTAMCLADLVPCTRQPASLHVVVQGFVDTTNAWWVSGPKRLPNDANGVGMIEYNIRGVR